MKKSFRHVSYLWDDAVAATLEGDEVALLVYRSNLLGADLRLTNYGGGNTSCKAMAPDPLTGRMTEVMWVKGSGGDLGTMKRNGLAALHVDRIRALEGVYQGRAKEDAMVALFNHCLYDLDSRAPSIDTPLHAFLPFRHIDHLHPDHAGTLRRHRGMGRLAAPGLRPGPAAAPLPRREPGHPRHHARLARTLHLG
jgi:rhamnose utilization protein RhaD (predicted bifunctional aldolase and dehydrogenase)